jgi:hypothetical protein
VAFVIARPCLKSSCFQVFHVLKFFKKRPSLKGNYQFSPRFFEIAESSKNSEIRLIPLHANRCAAGTFDVSVDFKAWGFSLVFLFSVKNFGVTQKISAHATDSGASS